MPSLTRQTEMHAVRRRSAWLIALPLVAIGSLLAHQLAYRLVAGAHADVLLAETGHGYLEQVPTGGVLSAVCLMLGLALATFDRVRESADKAIPAWLIALVPLCGFALQEHAERLFASGQVPWTASLDPTFLVGLALQLPFAALAFIVARALLRTVAAVVAALLERIDPPGQPRHVALWPRRSSLPPSTWRSRSCPPRGPPALRIV